jgi:hypothetical protein
MVFSAVNQWHLFMAPIKPSIHTEKKDYLHMIAEKCRQTRRLWPNIFPNLKHIQLNLLIRSHREDLLHVGSLSNRRDFFQCLDPKVTILQEACNRSEVRILVKQVSVRVSCERCRRHGVHVNFSMYLRDVESCQEEMENLSQPACPCESRLQKTFENCSRRKSDL